MAAIQLQRVYALDRLTSIMTSDATADQAPVSYSVDRLFSVRTCSASDTYGGVVERLAERTRVLYWLSTV